MNKQQKQQQQSGEKTAARPAKIVTPKMKTGTQSAALQGKPTKEPTKKTGTKNDNTEIIHPSGDSVRGQSKSGTTQKSSGDSIVRWIQAITAIGMLLLAAASCQTASASLKVADKSEKIADQSRDLADINTPLTYTAKVLARTKQPVTVSVSNTSKQVSLSIPVKITSKVETGQAKHVYAAVRSVDANDNTKPIDERFSFVNLEGKSTKNLDLNVSAEPDKIKKTPIQAYVIYLDMNNNIVFDYYVIFPTYIDGGHAGAIIDGKDDKLPSQVTPIKYRYVYFTNYDLVSRSSYDDEVKRYLPVFSNTPSYSTVKSQSQEIIGFLNHSLLVNSK